jgi:hypothetical protein
MPLRVNLLSAEDYQLKLYMALYHPDQVKFHVNVTVVPYSETAGV